MLMGATALLYIGPLMAGLGGYGWGVVPVFFLIFMFWLFILRPHQWPRKPQDWFSANAMANFATQGAVQVLLVAVLFGIGRGIGGALGVIPPFPVVLPIAVSFLSIPICRLIWDPWKHTEMDQFLDDAIARVAGAPTPADPDALAHARRMIAPLADLPNSTDLDHVAQHLLALSAHANTNQIRAALLERQRSGHASRAETLALILHATDGALIEAVGEDGPTLTLAVLPRDPEFIALYAQRLTLALDGDADLWGQCPGVDLLMDLVVALNNTEAEGPLRELVAATNRAQPPDGLA